MHNLPDDSDQFSSRNLFEAFKMQLLKDFEQSNFPADFVKALEPNYNSILEIIARKLRDNETKTNFNLMQLLYRVDISEAQLNRYLTRNKDRNHFDVVAELIIKRVLQKVVIRQHYKNSENS